MTAKEKLVGIILIVLGALSFLIKIGQIKDILAPYPWILPGEIIYQIVIIALGALLLFSKKKFKQLK